jgi:hypothetical protein
MFRVRTRNPMFPYEGIRSASAHNGTIGVRLVPWLAVVGMGKLARCGRV